VVPNDLTASNQQQASASLANFNWLPGGGPTQYVSNIQKIINHHQ